MKNQTCYRCMRKFKSDKESNLCADCKREDSTNVYKIIAIIILLVGLIVGIILGNTNKILELTYESSISSEYNEYSEVFNTTLMLCTWAGSFAFSLFIFATHSICHRLDLLINKTKE